MFSTIVLKSFSTSDLNTVKLDSNEPSFFYCGKYPKLLRTDWMISIIINYISVIFALILCRKLLIQLSDSA